MKPHHVQKLIIFIFAILALCLLPGLVLAAKPIGEVNNLEGKAFATLSGQKRELASGAQVFEKDSLQTMESSKIVITFLDDTVLRMGENTNVSLEQYSFEDKPDGIVGMVTRFFRGLVRMTTGKIVKRDRDKFSFQTPLATLGIRGTEFFAQTVDDGEEIGVTSMESGHQVALASSSDQTSINEQGYYVKVGRDGKFSPLMRISNTVSTRIMRMQNTFTRMKMQRAPRMPHQ